MDNQTDIVGDAADGTQKRERTQIDFPYADMGSAEELTSTLFEKGGGTAEPPQLAGWLDMSANGGTFRSRVSAARMFGFVETSRGSIEITDLGRRVADDAQAPSARAEAFLNVPLFEAMFQKNKGYGLPPAAAIERQMVELGVPVKQKERARQVFQKSADRAQFIDQSSGRLIKPSITPPPPRDDGSPPPPPPGGGSGSGGGDDLDLHPFVQGLLKTLPETGTKWSHADRVKWLTLAANAFEMIYEGDGNIVVKNVSPGGEAGASRVTGGADDPSSVF